MGVLPGYPVYVISKGRWEPSSALTARFLIDDGVDFRLVVEPPEVEKYAEQFGLERLEVLPFADLGQGSIPARNWVWEHANSQGHERHWILDDNIRGIYRRCKRIRVPCSAGPAMRATEDFVDRYENVAIAGLQYKMFVPDGLAAPPFTLNCHVYSCLLISHEIPNAIRWRGRYNEDADLCLQVLAAGWCTVLLNAFLADKIRTMTMKGGNSDELYQDDGRLRMARELERAWPGVVKVGRRVGRPQHIVADSWKRFDTPLRRRAGVDIESLPPNEYGMKLVKTKEITSREVQEFYDETR